MTQIALERGDRHARIQQLTGQRVPQAMGLRPALGIVDRSFASADRDYPDSKADVDA